MSIEPIVGFLANIFTILIGVLQIRVAIRRSKLGNPRTWLFITGGICLIAPAFFFFGLWLKSQSELKIRDLQISFLIEKNNLSIQMDTIKQKNEILTDSIRKSRTVFDDILKELNEKHAHEVAEIKARTKGNMQNEINNDIAELENKHQSEIADITSKHLIEISKIEEELKKTREEKNSYSTKYNDLVTTFNENQEELLVYRKLVGDLENLNNVSIVTPESLKYYSEGIKLELDGDRNNILRSQSKRIKSYEESIKYYKLAGENGFKGMDIDVKRVLIKKDKIDKDNVPNKTIE